MQKQPAMERSAYFIQVPAEMLNAILGVIPASADIHVVAPGRSIWQMASDIISMHPSLGAVHIFDQSGHTLRFGSILLPVKVSGCLKNALRSNCMWSDLPQQR